MKELCTKLHPVSLGLSLGILSGVLIFFMGLFAMGGYGVEYVAMVGSVYVGYAPTFLGSLLGGIWGFIEGFIVGALVAWLYNCFLCKCCKSCKKEGEVKTDKPTF